MVNKNRAVVFVKLGGSLITDKRKPFFLRKQVLFKVIEEIRELSGSDKYLVFGNGNGSFGHIVADKYQTHKGMVDDKSIKGIVEVAELTTRLNNIVVREFVEAGLPAVSLSPRSNMVARNHKLGMIFPEAVEQALRFGMIPVLHGDQVLDSVVGSTIFSTERVLGYLALEFNKKGYTVEKIIHCGETDGVYDKSGKTIRLINRKNFSGYKNILGKSHGIDVTGGMMHKVEEALDLADKGIPALIINGRKRGNLTKAILGKAVEGTKVEK